jgi:hypothetical protein
LVNDQAWIPDHSLVIEQPGHILAAFPTVHLSKIIINEPFRSEGKIVAKIPFGVKLVTYFPSLTSAFAVICVGSGITSQPIPFVKPA